MPPRWPRTRRCSSASSTAISALWRPSVWSSSRIARNSGDSSSISRSAKAIAPSSSSCARGAGRRGRQPLHPQVAVAADDLGEQPLLGAEVVVQEPARHPRLAGDDVERRAGRAARADRGAHRVDDPLRLLAGELPPGCGRGLHASEASATLGACRSGSPCPPPRCSSRPPPPWCPRRRRRRLRGRARRRASSRATWARSAACRAEGDETRRASEGYEREGLAVEGGRATATASRAGGDGAARATRPRGRRLPARRADRGRAGDAHGDAPATAAAARTTAARSAGSWSTASRRATCAAGASSSAGGAEITINAGGEGLRVRLTRPVAGFAHRDDHRRRLRRRGRARRRRPGDAARARGDADPRPARPARPRGRPGPVAVAPGRRGPADRRRLRLPRLRRRGRMRRRLRRAAPDRPAPGQRLLRAVRHAGARRRRRDAEPRRHAPDQRQPPLAALRRRGLVLLRPPLRLRARGRRRRARSRRARCSASPATPATRSRRRRTCTSRSTRAPTTTGRSTRTRSCEAWQRDGRPPTGGWIARFGTDTEERPGALVEVRDFIDEG